MNKLFLSYFFILAAMMATKIHCASFRGASSRIVVGETAEDGDEPRSKSTRLLSKQVTDLNLCVEVASEASNDHYFWMVIAKDQENIYGSCLVTIPTGTDEGDWMCCTASPNPTEYDSSWNLVLSDPITITNTSSKAYQACGENGGASCPNYNYEDNQAGFRAFKVVDGKNSNDLTGHMDKFVFKNHKCGLTKEAGTTCDFTYKEYNHAHVGKGYCLKGGVTLAKQGWGCNAWGWKCLDSDC